MLQVFQRRLGYCLGDGLTVLAWEIAQQSRDVAFQRTVAGVASKQGCKWLQVRR